MRQVRLVSGVVVLGTDFKELGVIRSLGQGISAIVVESRPCSAWPSRYITRCFSWEGSMESPERPHNPQHKEAYS